MKEGNQGYQTSRYYHKAVTKADEIKATKLARRSEEGDDVTSLLMFTRCPCSR